MSPFIHSVFRVRLPPPKHFLRFFIAVKKRKKYTSVFGLFLPLNAKNRAWKQPIDRSEADFTVFWPFLPQNARKNLFCRGRQKRFLWWQGHKDLNPEPTVLETAALRMKFGNISRFFRIKNQIRQILRQNPDFSRVFGPPKGDLYVRY